MSARCCIAGAMSKAAALNASSCETEERREAPAQDRGATQVSANFSKHRRRCSVHVVAKSKLNGKMEELILYKAER